VEEENGSELILRRRTAYHESGHAVSAKTLGAEVSFLWVRSDWNGNTRYLWATKVAPDADPTATDADRAARARLNAKLAIAGLLAEFLLDGTPPEAFLSHLIDFREGRDGDAVGRIRHSSRDIDALDFFARESCLPVDALVLESAAELQADWHRVKALADFILERWGPGVEFVRLGSDEVTAAMGGPEDASEAGPYAAPQIETTGPPAPLKRAEGETS